MFEKIFDDGSRLILGADGSVLGAVDNTGQSVPTGSNSVGAGIVSQFADLFNYGIRSAIDARYRTTQQQQQREAALLNFQMQSATQRQMLGLGLLVAGAVVAVKLLSR